MIQILPKVKSFGEEFGQQFGGGIGKGFSEQLNLNQKNKEEEKKKLTETKQIQEENKQIEEETGIKMPSGLVDPKMRKTYFDAQYKANESEVQRKWQQFQDSQKAMDKFNADQALLQMKIDAEEKKAGTKKATEANEKIRPLKGALQIVNKMRAIRKKGNLGIGASAIGLWGGETAKDVGSYQTLGNSLISFASTIPIRNKVEFEKLAGHLSDPNITDKEAEGILNEMETIINNSINQYQIGEEETPTKMPVGIGKPDQQRESLEDIWK